MTELKCPFCNSELHKDSDGYYTCYTDNCECMKYGGNGASGSESLWLALIRMRKALDIATGFIKGISQTVINDCDNQYVVLGNLKKFAQDTLNQIKTITEQKDNK